jgi:plasmid stabilization system protein ParE
MRFKVSTRRSAKADIRNAVNWYRQQHPSLGKDFLEKVKTVLQSLEQTPRRHQLIHGNIRRALLERFPYGVYYSVENQEVEVIGVFHLRRSPTVWQQRIDR